MHSKKKKKENQKAIDEFNNAVNGFLHTSKAADQGLREAQYNLGVFFYNGINVPIDYEKAFCYFQKAATNNLAIAQYNLATCFHYGQGTKQDVHKAIIWYRKAVDQGIVDLIDC